VREFILFRSLLTSQGAVHTPLKTFVFSGYSDSMV
jgi:2'-5' RNA ligase